MIRKGSIQEHIENYPENRGWVIGEFLQSDNPLYNPHVQVKWATHSAGESRTGSVSEAPMKSIDIVLSGRCQIVFPSHDMIVELSAGEYVTYDTSLCTHNFTAITDCQLIVIRTRQDA